MSDSRHEYERLIETQFLRAYPITPVGPWHLAKLVGYANTCPVFASTEDDDARGIRLRPYPVGTLAVTGARFETNERVTLEISVCEPVDVSGYPERVRAVWDRIEHLQIESAKLFKEIWDETPIAPDDPVTWRDLKDEPL